MFSQSTQTVKKSIGGKQLPVSPSNTVTSLSFGRFNGETGSKLDHSNGVTSPKQSAIRKDNQSSSTEIGDKLTAGSGGKLKENGIAHNSSHVSPLSNGNKETKVSDGINITSLRISENNMGHPEEFPSLTPHHDGVSLKEVSGNGTINGKVQKDDQQASNGPLLTTGDLLPRGLINSGNLCFLSATLQALLACSQLVKLLQELRGRRISKVCFLFVLLIMLMFESCGFIL